ncbi:copper homeostasis CutC domain-containing protein [Biscogniauxia mediterranea]|nr:copper homeostasis CutC domain-containing protein [Biscogniauxia mediterranea]
MGKGIGLEVPIFGASAAERTVHLGASRLELNATGSYPAGGLTPSLADLELVSSLNVPLRIMIRPRGPPPEGRDFIYSEDEFVHMERDIRQFKESGLLQEGRGDGFVFGILEEAAVTQKRDSQSGQEEETDACLPECWVDVKRCAHLVDASCPFRAVFHRAFDEIVSSGHDKDRGILIQKALDDLSACRFSAVLTSGGLGKAIQNVGNLRNIIEQARPSNIEIIVGGGVRKTNINDLAARLNLGTKSHNTFVHSACLSEQSSEEVDEAEVQGIVTQLQQPPGVRVADGRSDWA